MDVTVVGSCNVDLFTYADRFPKPGESLTGHKYVVGFGGKGANQCVAASRLGCRAAMVGKVGQDDYGNSTISNFKKNNISIDHVKQTDQADTGIAAITITDAGENAIIVVPQANLLLNSDDVLAAEDLIQNTKVVVCQLEVGMSATLETLKLAKKHKVRCVFNTAPGVKDLSAEFIEMSDILCANETEAELLVGIPVTDITQAEKALGMLLEKGCQCAIITLGEKGSIFASVENRKPVYVPGDKVKTVDTSGAGDCFVGSLAYYLSCRPDLTLEESIRRSNTIAGISVQSPGTQYSYLWKKDLSPSLFQ